MLLWVVLMGLNSGRAQTPLTTLNYKVVGTYLKVSPTALAVPKGIAGSVLVEVANADGSDKRPDNSIIEGAYIEATCADLPSRPPYYRPGQYAHFPACPQCLGRLPTG